MNELRTKFLTLSRVMAVMLAGLLGTGLSLYAQEAFAAVPSPPATAPARAAAPAGGARGAAGRGPIPTGGGRAAQGGFGAAFGGGGRGGGGFGGGVAEPPTPQPTFTRAPIATDGPSTALSATIYNVRLPLAQIGRIDIDALTKAAAAPADFEKALAALGTVQPLYHVDQSLRLKGDYIQVGTSEPYITNSLMTQANQTINSVAYTSVGALFNVTGTLTPSGGMNIDLSIQLAVKADGDTQISDTVTAPNFQTTITSHKGPVQPRVPFVVMSVDAGSSGTSGMGSACIARVIFGQPE